ncbi:MAG: PqqD family protein [Planctomycetes bacterium]|nr:PqqD family protein [Planctomycetota bacterium]
MTPPAVPPIELTTCVRQVAECACQVMDGETILIVPKDRVVHLLNETGSEIWAAIEKPARVRDVVDRVCREFEIDAPSAERDTLEFLREMASKRLIQVVPDVAV